MVRGSYKEKEILPELSLTAGHIRESYKSEHITKATDNLRTSSPSLSEIFTKSFNKVRKMTEIFRKMKGNRS